MDFRKIFDQIPEQFDAWRPRYCDKAFADIIAFSGLGPGKKVLEIGPGTGQATEPILKTGCSYLAVELGENLTQSMKRNFGSYDNFAIVNGDFETCELEAESFDLVYSAATIQWIPEQIGFPKVNRILKKGGAFAMLMTRDDYKSANEALYEKIQQVYKRYFFPEHEYTCKLAYENVVKYGFGDFERRTYAVKRELSAEEFAAYTGTHCTHIDLKEPNRSNFFNGVKQAIKDSGNKITLNDTVVLYLARKN